mmetsp:Transcript_33931/g.45327  ORF Transcript_33931/g.45327 Transcript_33931/m.45327 type:complete len:109 (+) Transcript_33931:180-506(+)
MYGFIASMMGNIHVGYRYAKLALSFFERFDNREVHCSTITAFWVLVAPWHEHSLGDTLEHIRHAFKVGMEIGDHENAMFAMMMDCTHSFYSGCPLAILLDQSAERTEA